MHSRSFKKSRYIHNNNFFLSVMITIHSKVACLFFLCQYFLIYKSLEFIFKILKLFFLLALCKLIFALWRNKDANNYYYCGK